jgi:hypothetical protein
MAEVWSRIGQLAGEEGFWRRIRGGAGEQDGVGEAWEGGSSRRILCYWGRSIRLFWLTRPKRLPI